VTSKRTWLLELRTPVAAIAAAVLVLNLLSWGFGQAPLSTLMTALAGSWGTTYGIGQVLFKATPLLLAGIAVDLALRAGLFNIGVEGQIAVGSLAGTVVAVALPAALPAVVALPVTLIAAAAAGACWAALAGWMRTRFGAHEVITTIMLNRIADAMVAMVMTAWLALPATVRTKDIAPGAAVPRLESIVDAFAGSAASWAFPMSVLVLVGVTLWLRRSRVGREVVWVGHNERACAAEGIPVARRKTLAMGLSGAIAALAMAGTVLGYKGYYEIGLGAGVGFGGIAVAFLGRGKPLGLLLAALLFGTLAQAGLVINAQVPKEATGILEAVVIITVALASRAAVQDASRRASKGAA
jgi:simple sugar transport system permease protein